MTIFNDYEAAKEYAEIRCEDLEYGECVLVMKRGSRYLVTTDYKGAKNDGWEYVLGVYNYEN